MKLEMPEFQKAKLLVIGDIMLDRYWHGSASRVSPEAPVPVVCVDSREGRPGGAGNVALNISALGSAARLIGVVGKDETGEELQSQLQAASVYCDFLWSQNKPTITKLRVISQHQHLIRLDFEQLFEKQDVEGLFDKAERLVKDVNAIVFSDYNKGALGEISKMIELGRYHKKPIIIDPKGTDFQKYKGATIITPNLSEFESVVGQCNNEQELVDKGLGLVQELSLDALLITRGEHGMTLIRLDAPELHLPARAQEVFDVSGAGDTVIAYIASGVANGKSLFNATEIANDAAGISVGKFGTTVVNEKDLLNSNQKHKLCKLKELNYDLKKYKNKTIGFTNGCFDLIHQGHIFYLKEARKMCDFLILGLNSDNSIKKIKGKDRPILNQMERTEILANFDFIDKILIFNEETPINLIKKIRPNIIFKGDDYSIDEVVGSKVIKNWGGKIKLIKCVKGKSTSNIIRKIKNVT